MWMCAQIGIVPLSKGKCVCVCVVRPRESTKTRMQNEYNQVHLIYRLCKQNKMQQ